jgi:hypothetical protein
MLAGMDRQQLAAIRQKYREANVQRLKTVKRVAVSVSQLRSDGANGYGTPRQSGDLPYLHLNGAAPGSNH